MKAVDPDTVRYPRDLLKVGRIPAAYGATQLFQDTFRAMREAGEITTKIWVVCRELRVPPLQVRAVRAPL